MKRGLAWLASYRLRILFRACFLLLGLAVVGLALTVLQEEKQRGHDHYRAGAKKTMDEIVARLRHPSGQLALLNPPRQNGEAAKLHPVVLPFSAIDFDDQTKVRHAVEMAGCLVQYPHEGSLCVAVGNNPWAGGFIYAAGTFVSGPLAAHRIGDQFLDGAHRLRVSVSLRGHDYRWIAPFEPLATPAVSRAEGVRGRFTGYTELPDRDYTGERPVKDFRGWVWQSGRCLEGDAAEAETCERKSFFSLRLPIDVLRDALFQIEKPVWPPPDLDRVALRLEVLSPGDAPALFDSDTPGAVPPFSLNDLNALLLPGESLSLRKLGGGRESEVLRLAGREDPDEVPAPWLARLVNRLPVEHPEAPVELADEVATPLGKYRIVLTGDARSANQALGAVASRVSWFVLAMLLALAVAWAVIELGIIGRIGRLTRRATGLSSSVKGSEGLAAFDLSDLRGRDELGLLANCLNDLLRRVKEDAERERIRAEQEKDQWHAVGHEIMSPLQSLLALHGSETDPSLRYLKRMQQAVRTLYGSASVSEAFQATHLKLQPLDLTAFLTHVAENAGLAELCCELPAARIEVRADEYSLEDVLAHLLRNAERYRQPGTPIVIRLEADESNATLTLRNTGPRIPDELMGRIFEYGVSGESETGSAGNRGQGLFVAKTYLAKMGGTIGARNEADGVSFVITLPRARPA